MAEEEIYGCSDMKLVVGVREEVAEDGRWRWMIHSGKPEGKSQRKRRR